MYRYATFSEEIVFQGWSVNESVLILPSFCWNKVARSWRFFCRENRWDEFFAYASAMCFCKPTKQRFFRSDLSSYNETFFNREGESLFGMIGPLWCWYLEWGASKWCCWEFMGFSWERGWACYCDCDSFPVFSIALSYLHDV